MNYFGVGSIMAQGQIRFWWQSGFFCGPGQFSRIFYHWEIGHKLTFCSVSKQFMNKFLWNLLRGVGMQQWPINQTSGNLHLDLDPGTLDLNPDPDPGILSPNHDPDSGTLDTNRIWILIQKFFTFQHGWSQVYLSMTFLVLKYSFSVPSLEIVHIKRRQQENLLWLNELPRKWPGMWWDLCIC